MIRKSGVLALGAAALTGGLVTTLSPSPAWADTLCAKAVSVVANLSPGSGTYVQMFGAAPYIAGVSLNDLNGSMGVVAEAFQAVNGAYVSLYNSASSTQQIRGWALMTYRC